MVRRVVDVIRGMRATLEAYRPVLICELDDATDVGLARKIGDLSALLASLGYRLERLAACYPSAGWQVAHFVARPSDV